MARQLLEQKYRKIIKSIDLHYLNPSQNSDKVYHLAVLSRDDGKFDAVYRYGRRGKKLQEGVIAGGFTNQAQANSAIWGKMVEQTDQGYVDAPGITPAVWDSLLLRTPPRGWTDSPTTGPGMWNSLSHGRRVLIVEMGRSASERYTVQVFEDGTITQQGIGGAGGLPHDIVRHATLQGDLEGIMATADLMAEELRSESYQMITYNVDLGSDPGETKQQPTVLIPPAPHAPASWFW